MSLVESSVTFPARLMLVPMCWIGKRPIYAYKTAGDRLDIGSLDSYAEADKILRQERA